MFLSSLYMEQLERKRRFRHVSLFALLAALSLLPACSSADRTITNSVQAYPYDYRQRHPIILTDAPRTLDVFANGHTGYLDPRQADDVRAFIAEYDAVGKGGITVVAPYAGRGARGDRTVSQIRQVLGGLGHNGRFSISYYHPQNPSVAAPVRLSFRTMQAKVASQCGLWPEDLASGSSINGWENRPHWNLGCAMQNNMAAQVENPIDLVRSRAEGRADTLKRAGAIERLRQAKDPSTQYTSPTQINQAVGAQ
jgi:pilus assembly protein CpaD